MPQQVEGNGKDNGKGKAAKAARNKDSHGHTYSRN